MRDLASPLDGFLSPFGAVRGRVFSPLSLFASGEAGAWYDPSDLSTLYQDSLGTTPVTAAGQPVGLVLDKSQGLTLGSELAVNGTFDADTTGWVRGFASVDGTFTASGGVATYTVGAGDGASPRMVYAITGLTVGRSYKISYDRAGSSGAGDVGATFTSNSKGTGGVEIERIISSVWNLNETKTTILPATATTMYFAVFGVKSAGDTFSIDNVSVRELPGNHLTQATAAARPVYQTGPDRLDHDGVDDVMNVTLPDLGTDATVASVAGGTVTYLEAQTISGSYAAPTSDWAGLVIIDRALTADEKTALEGIWT